MTTIAACAIEGVMCSDSGWNDGDTRGETRKVFRVRGDLVGFAGDLAEIQAWLAAFRRRQEPKRSGISVLKLSANGQIHTWALGQWYEMKEKQFAIGTGGVAARVAMDMGATCRQAVLKAIKYDAGSFGPGRTYRV